MMSAPVLLPCGAGEDSTWQLQDLRVQRHARAHDGHAPLPRPQGALRRTRLQCRPTRIKTYTIDNSSTAVWAWHIAMHVRLSALFAGFSNSLSQCAVVHTPAARLCITASHRRHGRLAYYGPFTRVLATAPRGSGGIVYVERRFEVYFCCHSMRKRLHVLVLQRPRRRANEPVLLRTGAAAP